MRRKMMATLLAMVTALAVMCFGINAFADEADNSALTATLGRIASYEAADYTPESYAALSALYEQYAPQAETMTDQAEIDAATTALLEAMSDLKAYLKLNVAANIDADISVSYGETSGAAAGKYTAIYGDAVTVTAPAVEGYTFNGWFETVSKRYLSANSTYAFDMTVNTSLKAMYYNDSSATLTFASLSGQVFSATEKTAEEWAAYTDLDVFIPETVPYKYGCTNGRWDIGSNVLSDLAAGQSVTVVPQYDTKDVREFDVPAAVNGEVVLKLHYRGDSDYALGTFVMKAAVPEEITPTAAGMLFYYKKAESFNAAFDVNINNKMLASQYDELNKDTYITNMKKINKYSWAARGYVTYKVNGKTVTAYSNQVNVINSVDVHNPVAIEDIAATCTTEGQTGGTYCDICGDELTAPETTAALGHDYQLIDMAEATCTAAGYSTYECQNCGDTYTDETPALGHDWSDWTVVQAGTCTTKGIRSKECRRCDAVEEEQTDYDYSNHNYESVTYPATCTEDGFTEYTCTRCGDHYTETGAPATGHNYEDVDGAEATCTEDGYIVYECQNCGDTYTDETPALGHNWSDWTVVQAGTCTTKGIRSKECRRCDAVEEEQTDYDYSNHNYESVTYPATCTEDGFTEYTCTRCGDHYTETTIPATGHTASEAVRENETAASCTAAGGYESVVYCTVCGEEISRETVTVPALGHTPAAAVEENETAATCTDPGSYDTVIYCSVCGAELSRTTQTTPAYGHNWGAWEVTAPATAATCTTEGTTAIETRDCVSCGDTETRGGTVIPALGHDYTIVGIGEASCTIAGGVTYQCTRCGDLYTEVTPALGHTAGEAVEENEVEATCTEPGTYDTVVYCSVCGAELSRTQQTTPARGHNWSDWAVTTPATAATCTTEGTTAIETRDCVSCGDTETRGGTVIPALGHDYAAAVTAATCTAGGYTTYTCSRCGDSYTADATAALGHDLGEWTVVTPAAIGQAGERRRTCSRCDYYESETIPALTANIEVKLPHTDDYLYRAGNANNIAMGSLFKAIDDSVTIDSATVGLTIQNIAGNANGTFTANTSDWTAGTVKFTGTGVAKLTVTQNGNAVETLYLEVVAGTNYAQGATLGNVTSNNAVLLGDVSISTRATINNQKTLYGNGFSVTDNRSDTSGAGNSYITMNGGGSIDNAVLLGQIYQSAVTSGQENQYYAPGVWITGDANIYNSYVSETKNAVQVDAGTVYFENTTFAGGAIANVDIGGGDVTFKNCITCSSNRGGLNGLGIRPKTASCKIHLLGTFTQYNYLKKSDLPSNYSSVLSSAYNNTTYAYTYDGSTYLNMGIFFVSDASITAAQAQAAIDDQTANSYGYLEKTTVGITGTVYTRTAATGSPDLLTAPAYDVTVNGQYPTLAPYAFDYTTKNYIARTEGSNRYCYYDSTTKSVQISFEKENTSSCFNWDPMILSVTKHGNTIPYTVSMNGTDYTNGTISFSEEGDYTVTYTYTDPYNYDKDGNAFNVTYTKTVNISVTAVEPDAQVYPCDFNYDGAAGNYSAKKVIGTDSKTYVMPDVSATSSTIGSTTVAGKTVYYPIVNVGPTNSSGNTAYSSGKGYYFAPVFSEIHIRDFNQETGAQQYEYSKSTSTWPHGKSATAGPDTAYFTCASGEKTWSGTSPYARSTNSQYYRYGKNNLGVCYTTCEIEKDNSASNHLVQYHYVSNDGTTYYFYVYYKFAAMTYASCVTNGTLVTMGDGTMKPIEDVKVGDMVMTWSMWNGCYEAQPVVMRWYHGTDEWRVLTLNFSDGTAVRTIKEHGFFDADKNTYAYITEDNVASYIGDRFIKQNADGSNTEVTLTDYEVTHETVGSYSIQTAFNENFMVEGMLSMTGEDYRGRFEYFDIGDGMRYDQAKMQADIDRYGLYSYEEFSDYLTPEQFAMFNGAYFKVLVGKGVMTYEDIFKIMSDNL